MKHMNQILFMGLKEIQLKNIIPSTWWEGGIMLSREVGEGLNMLVFIQECKYLIQVKLEAVDKVGICKIMIGLVQLDSKKQHLV